MPRARVVTGAPSSFNVTPVSDGAAQELKFGLFVPQGWGLDLVGLEPADHWGAMRSVAELADRSPDDVAELLRGWLAADKR